MILAQLEPGAAVASVASCKQVDRSAALEGGMCRAKAGRYSHFARP